MNMAGTNELTKKAWSHLGIWVDACWNHPRELYKIVSLATYLIESALCLKSIEYKVEVYGV